MVALKAANSRDDFKDAKKVCKFLVKDINDVDKSANVLKELRKWAATSLRRHTVSDTFFSLLDTFSSLFDTLLTLLNTSFALFNNTFSLCYTPL